MPRSGKTASSESGDPGASLPSPVALITSEPGGSRSSTASFSSAAVEHDLALWPELVEDCAQRLEPLAVGIGDHQARGRPFAAREAHGDRRPGAAGAEAQGLPAVGPRVRGQELAQRPAGGDRILGVADESSAPFRDAGDLAAQPGVRVELVEQRSGVPVDVDLVRGHEGARDRRVLGDLLDRGAEGLRRRAERNVSSFERRIDAEDRRPAREQLECARPRRGGADEQHPVAHDAGDRRRGVVRRRSVRAAAGSAMTMPVKIAAQPASPSAPSRSPASR